MIIRVFIPVYNPDKVALKQTLDSLSFSYCGNVGLAITVVDNCSDVVVSEMLAGNSCNLIRNDTNLGRIQNWNKCLEIFRREARDNDVMKFLFVGYTLEPECLSMQSQIMDRGFDVVSSAHHVNPFRGDSYVMNHSDGGDMIITAKEAVVLSQIKGNWLAGCMACPMFGADVLGDIEFETSMSWASDWKFWTDLMARAKSIYYMDKPLVNFNAQHRAHFLATQSEIQKQEEDFMKGYLSEISKAL